MTAPRVLVIGGTGVLREAVPRLAATYDVTVTGRRPPPPRLPRSAVYRRVDTADPRTRLPGGFDAAVVYGPAAHDALLLQLAGGVGGPLVLLVTSAALHDPAARVRSTIARTGAVPLLLGWAGSTVDPRWHTPREIAAAALDVLRRREPLTLGRLDRAPAALR